MARGARSVFTIHNLAYQGVFPKEFMVPSLGLPWDALPLDEALEFHDQLNFMKAGLVFADALTTVSPTYAREILTVEGGYGLDAVLRSRSGDLSGILNGIDDATSGTRPTIPTCRARFDRRDLAGKARVQGARSSGELGLPVTAPTSPLVGHGGAARRPEGRRPGGGGHAGPAPLRTPSWRCWAAAQRESTRSSSPSAAATPPEPVAARIGFDEGLAHRIEAGADVFLMPSRFEPCGLNQMYSLRYGTVPVVRAVGGLVDTVEDYDGLAPRHRLHLPGATTAHAMITALRRALDVYRDESAWFGLMERGMAQDFSWARSAAATSACSRSCGPPRR